MKLLLLLLLFHVWVTAFADSSVAVSNDVSMVSNAIVSVASNANNETNTNDSADIVHLYDTFSVTNSIDGSDEYHQNLALSTNCSESVTNSISPSIGATKQLDEEENKDEYIDYYDARFCFTTNGFSIIDISNPDDPDVVCTYLCPGLGNIVDYYITNINHAIVNGTGGIYDFELSDPFSPSLVKATFTNEVEKMSFSTNSLFVIDGVHYDFGTNEEIRVYGSDRDLRGFRVFACGNEGIRIFKDPRTKKEKAEEVTRAKTNGDARYVLADSGQIWVVQGVNGLGAYEMDEYGLLEHKRDFSLISGFIESISSVSDMIFVICTDGKTYCLPSDLSKRHALQKIGKSEPE